MTHEIVHRPMAAARQAGPYHCFISAEEASERVKLTTIGSMSMVVFFRLKVACL